ncbi:preprotein translocase subunit SecE [Buchnera aphidicola]|uniref:preprotein translocase subunit SecE n=1 Tax=Buchnera aphidicola TaxID=9 RepID=UPI0020921367|nr:preprotein translocase subunit SecE [Buchnera aphidicola]USS94168.1 preprotein translocase subunit SecE [Buchnera aphidicola (Sipha maydis)]WII23716.1 preprotein translocase subunit SecE [Buchnera aphidicola (Sipha maydis)]
MKSNILHKKKTIFQKIWIFTNIFLILFLFIEKKFKFLPIQNKYIDLFIILIIVGTIFFVIEKNFSYIISIFQDAKSEIKNIHYPTIKDTFNTTCIIILISSILAIILWGIDGILFYIMSFTTPFQN